MLFTKPADTPLPLDGDPLSLLDVTSKNVAMRELRG